MLKNISWQKTLLVFSGSLLSFLGTVNAAEAAQLSISTFDTNAEGWLVQGDTTTANPLWQPSAGNPDGHIKIVDEAVGGVMYWLAPPKFLGDKSAAYLGTLSYDLKQLIGAQAPDFFQDIDVMLVSPTLTLSYQHNPAKPPLPLGDWRNYQIDLDATKGNWTIGNTGVAANNIQMQNVLSNLTGLKIRAEYQTGNDIDFLDNAILTSNGNILDNPTAIPESSFSEALVLMILTAGFLLPFRLR